MVVNILYLNLKIENYLFILWIEKIMLVYFQLLNKTNKFKKLVRISNRRTNIINQIIFESVYILNYKLEN